MLFYLSGESVELAKEEVLALSEKKKCEVDGRLLFLEGEVDYERLALTKYVFGVLFWGEEKLKEFDWEGLVNKSYAVRFPGDREKEKKLADFIWSKVREPRVDLEEPEMEVFFFNFKNELVGGIKKWQNEESFEGRKAHKREGFHPSSLNPKLARAMVNLSGSKTKVVDPFCGTGGILIEAGLIGLKVEGYDIEEEMVERARVNLEDFGAGGFKLDVKDSFELKEEVDYLVTDLPYGKATKMREGFYEDFVKMLKEILGKRAVVGVPGFKEGEFKRLLKKVGLKVRNKFEVYLHKSLSKVILVIEK